MQRVKARRWVKSLTSTLAAVGASTLLSMPAALAQLGPYSLFQPMADTGMWESEDNLSISERLEASSQLGRFGEALEQAGMTEQLASLEKVTIFAPTNAALNSQSMQQMLRSGSREDLARFVSNHILVGEVPPALIEEGGGEVRTLGGETIRIQVNQQTREVVLNNAARLNYGSGQNRPLEVINGVILQIDRVLQPTTRSLRIENNSGQNIVALYVDSSGSRTWSQEQLGHGALRNGQSVNANLSGDCMYDIKAVFQNGQSMERRQVDTCSSNYISVENAVAQYTPVQPQPMSAAPAQSGFYCDNSNGIPQTRYKSRAGGTEVWINWGSDHFADAGYDSLRRCEIVSGRLENFRRNRQLNYIGVGWQNGQEIICAATEAGQCRGLIYTLKPGQDGNETLDRFMRLRRGEASAPSLWESDDDAALFIDVREFLEQGSPSPRIAPAPSYQNRPRQPQRNDGGMREL
ncbi:MAG: COP23 domain-containing protein [Hormoscilla sp.]